MNLRFSSFFLFASLAAACGGHSTSQGTSSSAIIGGKQDRAHRYVVAVAGKNGPFCTGTLISARTVLTAGHCDSPPHTKPTYVWFGADLNAPEHKIKVVGTKRHPGYQNEQDQVIVDDLAVLQLATDAPVQPAPLLRATLDNTPTYIGKSFTFVGYGVTNAQNETNPDGMRHVGSWPVTLIGPGPLPEGDLPMPDSSFLSVSSDGENLCNGDSGGPAFFVANGVEHEAGVASTVVNGWCKDGQVSARTDQKAIDGFLQGVIDAFENGNACRSDGACNESCNAKGEVLDPDCAEKHCGKDGVCAIACVDPVDPDCPAP